MTLSVKGIVQTTSRAIALAKIAGAARRAAHSDGAARENAQRALALLLADARGVPMKVGQFLASSSEGAAFRPLVDGIDARPLSEMLPVLEESLGRPWDEVFQSLEESEAAASLGQVHRAVLLDGTVVAVKILYPDIAQAVAAELRLAGLMPGVGPARKWGFDLGAYKRTLKANMDRELDYRSEGERQQFFGREVRVAGLVVPKVYSELSSETCLVQSWETGLSLDDLAIWPHKDRLAVAKTLMSTLFMSLFVAGEVHCDPHVGNVYYRKSRDGTPLVILMDYGCTVSVPEEARLALLKLILGCIEKDDTDPLACFVAMGFDCDKLLSISDMVPAMSGILFEPFLTKNPYSTKYWSLGARLGDLLGDLKWWFRSAGPAELFLLMRAFHGLVEQLTTLQVILPWQLVLRESVGPEMLARARAYAPPGIPRDKLRKADTFSSLANHLHVRVTENGNQVVKVTMPASQVVTLEEQIPEDVLERIVESGINLDKIIREICESGVIPQEVFHLHLRQREYRVWLE